MNLPKVLSICRQSTIPFLFLLILHFFPAHQLLSAPETFSVSGTVKDKETGEDIIGATVQIPSIKKGAVANKYGFYSMAIPAGKYVIIAKRIGYQQFQDTIDVKGALTFNISLSPQGKTTEDVVVTAQRKNDNVQ